MRPHPPATRRIASTSSGSGAVLNTETGGAMWIDLLLRDGATVEVARGGYGEFRQP